LFKVKYSDIVYYLIEITTAFFIDNY